mgnify:FL=1
MEQKNNAAVNPVPEVPAMPKAPAEKPVQRRVGSVTLGVCLAVTGICFLCYHFVPGFDWQLVLKIAPAAGLILLGGEVLYFACRPEKWKYDFLSVLVCLLLMGGCFGLSMLGAVWEELDPACRRNELKLGQEYTSALYTRISEEAPEIPLQDLTGQVHLYSAAVDSLEDIHSGTGSVEVMVELQGPYQSAADFAADCRTLADAVLECDVEPESICFCWVPAQDPADTLETGILPQTEAYSLQLSGPVQLNWTAAQMTEGTTVDDLREEENLPPEAAEE